MKKFWLILLMSLLVVSMIAGGCSKPASVQETEEAAENGTEKETSEEVIELKLAYYGTETGSPGQSLKLAAQIVEEKTGGKVKVTNYFSQSLLQMSDAFVGLANGVADIAYIPTVHTADIHPLSQVFTRLFETETPDRMGLQKAYEDVLNNFPGIQEEMEATGVRLLAIQSNPVYDLHTVKRLMKTPDDIKGERICIANGTPTDWLNSMPGAAAVNLPTGDYYMSLERNLVGGVFTPWEAIKDYSLLEVLHYHTIFGDGGAYSPGIGLMINLNTWNSLPSDIQEILVEAYKTATRELAEMQNRDRELIIKEAEERGDPIEYLTPEERQMWVDYMKPINEKWIEETEALGKPAREAYEALLEAFNKYK